MFTLSPEIAIRDEFARLCIERHLLGVAVEIGTLRAGFSRPFLDQWPGRMMACIDPYCATQPDEPAGRDVDYQFAINALTPHAPRVLFVREPSDARMAVGLARTSGDPEFVYIDGSHTYEGCKIDIEAWWPVMSPIGILAGHDYTPELPGVMQAVQEFAAREGVNVYLTHDKAFKSWYVYKQEPATLLQRYESAVFGDRNG